MLDTHGGMILFVMNDLIISKVVRNDIYQKFLNGTITEQDLFSYYGNPGRDGFTLVNGDTDVQRIPPYIHPQNWWQYQVWLYLSNPAGEFPENSTIEQNHKTKIESDLFNSPLISEFSDDLVKRILHDWLDPLQFFNSSGEEVS